MSRVVLVTGSEGFVGRHVVAKLSRSPDIEVVCLVRRRPAADHRAGTQLVHADFLTETGARQIARMRPDVVVHLAWEGLADFRSAGHLDQLAGHVRLLDVLVGAGVKRIIGVGTCLEYGLVEGELDESMPARPVVAYADAKTRLREQVEHLANIAGVSWCWTRVFYPYGPGQQPKSLWSALHSAIDRGDSEFPMSGGAQVRDYLHVREVGRLLALLAQVDSAFGPFNVCSGQPVTVRELVERWIVERRSTIRPRLGAYAYPDYEPMSFWGSTRNLDAALASAADVEAVEPQSDDAC